MISLRHLLAILMVTVAVMSVGGAAPAQAARNPFISSGKNEAAPAKDPSAGYPGFLHPAMQKIAAAQMALRQRLVRLAGEIRQNPFGRSFQAFMLLSMLYGVIHALGPGHGKIYACAYFLNRPGTFKSGLLFSTMTMVIHVFSGTILILAGALVLKASGAMALEKTAPILERTSYAMLTGLGVFLAVRTIAQMRASPSAGRFEGPEAGDTRSLVIAALAVGLVPCPGAAMILLFSLTLGILPAGLGAMIAIALGMSVTTACFALLTIGLKHRFLSLVDGNRRLFSAAYAAMGLVGAGCISVLGLVLFIGV